MKGCLTSLAGRGFLLVFLVALVWAGFRWGPEAVTVAEAWLSGEEMVTEDAGVVASADLAEETLDRFELFRTGAGGERLLLGSAELSSVVRHSLPGIIPPGVFEPTVEMAGGRLALSARVATSAFPDFPSIAEVMGVFPDTVDIVLRGVLIPFDGERVALEITRIHAARVPLPDRFIPRILEALGRQEREGLGENALVVPLPQGVRSAYLSGDSLVLVSDS